MGLDKAETDTDAKNNAGTDNRRMDKASPVHTMAPDKALRSFMDVGKASYIPNPTATRTEVARIYRIHDSYKVENVPIE